MELLCEGRVSGGSGVELHQKSSVGARIVPSGRSSVAVMWLCVVEISAEVFVNSRNGMLGRRGYA